MEVNGRSLKEVASRFKKLSTTVPQVRRQHNHTWMDRWLYIQVLKERDRFVVCVFTTG